MRGLVLLTGLWVLVLLPLQVEAYEVLILQSSHSSAYDDALKGLRSVRKFSERLLVLSDYSEVDLQRIVREEQPLVVLALGDNAYTAARKIRHTPVVVMMAPNYRAGAGGSPSITGVDLTLPPERYLGFFSSMRLKRVGVVASHLKSGQYMRVARQIDQRYGVELVVREVTSAREVAGQLASLRGVVDAIWLLPDDMAVTRETTDTFFQFAMQQQVPVIAFSGAYLKIGAACAVEINRQDVGRQAGELVSSLLSGSDVGSLQPQFPRRAVIRANTTVLQRFGLQVPDGVSVSAGEGR